MKQTDANELNKILNFVKEDSVPEKSTIKVEERQDSWDRNLGCSRQVVEQPADLPTNQLVLSDLSDKTCAKLQKYLNEMNFQHLPLLRSNLEKSTNHSKRINKSQKSQIQNSLARVGQNMEGNVHTELREIFEGGLKQVD